MARNENPPFGRGETFFNGGTATTSDPQGIIGKEWLFEDVSPTTHTVRTNRYVRCRAVRNSSGIALLPQRLAQFSTTAGSYGHEVTGYTATSAQRGYLIDEYLPAAGVPNNDVFWIVVDGPAMALTDIAAAQTVVVGDLLVALTAVTSQATTAGRVNIFDATGATLPLANQVIHYIGYALSAITAANTNSNVLIEVGHW